MVNTLDEMNPKRQSIVLCVDDIDLVDNEHAYRMLEDIRKFLSGNIVLVITYREQQLFDAVLDRKFAENRGLIERSVVNASELQNQAFRYLT